jgi:hypothetical protein
LNHLIISDCSAFSIMIPPAIYQAARQFGPLIQLGPLALAHSCDLLGRQYPYAQARLRAHALIHIPQVPAHLAQLFLAPGSVSSFPLRF